jgi:hypothetical protein
VPTRRNILRTLRIFQNDYPNSWLGARDIGDSSTTGPAFAETINRLLEEKLILVIRGGPGRESETACRLNPEKLGRVRNELIWHWKNWVVLAVALVAGVAAFLVTMVSIGSDREW